MSEYIDDEAIEASDPESESQRNYSEPMSASPPSSSSKPDNFATNDRKTKRREAAKRRSLKLMGNHVESSGGGDVSEPSNMDSNSEDEDDSDIIEENDPSFYAGLDNDEEAHADNTLHTSNIGDLARQAFKPKSGATSTNTNNITTATTTTTTSKTQSARAIVDDLRNKRKADESDESIDLNISTKRPCLDDRDPMDLPTTPVVPSKTKVKARSRAAAAAATASKPKSSSKMETNVNSKLKSEGETFRCGSSTYTVVHAGQPAPTKKSNSRNSFAWDLVNPSHFTTAVDADHNYDIFLQSEQLLPVKVECSKAAAIEGRAANRAARKQEALASANRVMSQDGTTLLRLIMPSQYFKQLVDSDNKKKFGKMHVPEGYSKKFGTDGIKMMSLALQSQLNVESLETIETKYMSHGEKMLEFKKASGSSPWMAACQHYSAEGMEWFLTMWAYYSKEGRDAVLLRVKQLKANAG